MTKEQAIKVLKSTGYIGNEVGVAFDVAMKSMKKLGEIEQIIKQHDNDSMPENYWYIYKIKEVLKKE